MPTKVVVLGAGYAGSSAVRAIEDSVDDASLTWISDTRFHLVLHEVHRVIRDPDVGKRITVPVESIKSPTTEFVEAEVTRIETDSRTVELAGRGDVEYDYLLVAIGSNTADFGIPGMAEHAHTLRGLDDALAIHDDIADAARAATADDPCRVVVGGAGLSGIQVAGEVASYRDEQSAPIEVRLVEALDDVLPSGDADLRGRLRHHLDAAGVELLTGDPVVEVEEGVIHFDERESLAYDVFVWAGGVTGRPALDGANVDARHNRVTTESTFRSSDDRVFAVGDAALVEQDGDVAPPTAQAAWDAATVAGRNVARAVRGERLERWTYEDKGTLVSIGDVAIAHDVRWSPIRTFGSFPARVLKKAAAARWIATVSSWRRALRAWDSL